MWNDWQFWRDATWRALRTFSQSLAALLVVVQSSGGAIHIPWQGYLYSSAVAGLISLLQSVDRGRAITSAAPPFLQAELAAAAKPAAADYQPAAALTAGPGCGGDMR